MYLLVFGLRLRYWSETDPRYWSETDPRYWSETDPRYWSEADCYLLTLIVVHINNNNN